MQKLGFSLSRGATLQQQQQQAKVVCFAFALLLLLTQQGLQTAMVLPISLLRRVITLWSMVALAAAVGTLPLSAGVQLRRDS